MEYPIEGACQCGQVSYQLSAKPQMVIACHCKECQKLATSPFSVTAMVKQQDIRFFGDLKRWNRKADSGNDNTAYFCPECGNRVYHLNPEQPEMLKLKLKPVLAEDDDTFEPRVHVWVKEKVAWYTVPEGVEVYDTQP